MSNYPPGVTGRELEIAGPDWEGDIERECTNTDIELEIILPEDIKSLKSIAAATGSQGSGKRRDADIMQQSMKRFFSRMLTVSLDECPFSGEVEAWSYGKVLHWTCPVCEREYEESDYDE